MKYTKETIQNYIFENTLKRFKVIHIENDTYYKHFRNEKEPLKSKYNLNEMNNYIEKGTWKVISQIEPTVINNYLIY
jgi:hypothetical protein